MLAALGRLVVRRRVAVLLVALAAFLASAVLGAGVAGRLSLGGFEDPAAESAAAARALENGFQGQPNLVLLVRAKTGTVDDPAVAAAGRALTEELAREPEVAGSAASYWSLGGPPPLKSRTGDSALVLARIKGDDGEVQAVAEHLVPKYTRDAGVVEVRPGGLAAVFDEVGRTIESDATRAEMLALPITLLLLVLVFGSVVAATLPLLVGVLSIVGTFLVLRLLAAVTDVSIYSLNLTTAMGLGLAIDYSLFVVSRFREELAAGAAVPDAVATTVRTAGRTVLFSALTVAVSLGALLVFPLVFLRSFAYAGIVVVALAGVGAVVVLPALLALLGHRVDKWVLWRHRPKPVGEGRWHRVAMFVMRRPLPITFGVVALLFVLGMPFLRTELGLPDDRVLPASAASRVVSDTIRADYDSNESAALSVVASGVDARARSADVDSYAAALSAVPGVARVDAVTGSYVQGRKVLDPLPTSVRFASPAGTFLSVVPGVEPVSPDGERLAKAVRAVDAPFDRLVGGPSAELVDTKSSILGDVPVAGLLIALSTFVVLFLSFGSVLVPLKAVVLNLLSLSATFGAIVWVFQDGNLSGVLDFTATGTIAATMPVLMFCIAFGLSMDYEVFLLSRIKEEHDRTGDNTRSVAVGLERTGRIVTAAALLISLVFAAFAVTSGISFMKMFGVGLTLAVLLDATLIRAALVPAFMKLAGEANWWAPRTLRRVYERWGFSEVEPPATAAERDPEPVGTG